MHLILLAALFTSIPQVQASEPNRQPELASAPGCTALVFGSGNSIWISTSRDNGNSFSPPNEVAHVPVLALGRHRGPRVVIYGKTILVSAVYGEKAATGAHAHGLPADGDLVVWRSTDEARSWSKPIVINDVPGSAREGLHAMAVGTHGEIAAVWLDLRSTGTRLYGAYSGDEGITWSKNVLIYQSPEGTICQCCGPSLTSSGNHQFAVMFRNVVHGTRDMYLENWNIHKQISDPQKLGTGAWSINGCPMDGGGLVRRGNSFVTAWRREQTVYLDEPGHPEIALGEGKDVAIALSAKGPYVAWTTASSGIEVHRAAEKNPSCLSAIGSFPALTSLSDGSVIAAWEQEGQIHVRTVH
jgi:hypothetical protein